MKHYIIILAVTILALTSCSPTTETMNQSDDLEPVTTTEPEEEQAATKEIEANQVEPTATEVVSTMTPDNLKIPGELPQVIKAKEDLARRLSIPKDSIEVVKVEAVTWPNGAIGCPQPGMAYAEVLTPGYLIMLNAGNKDYEYHASRGTEVIYCENPTPPVPGSPGDT